MSSQSNEAWCAVCLDGPFSGMHGLKVHTSLSHGNEVTAERQGAECCNGMTNETCGTGRRFCVQCGIILEEA